MSFMFSASSACRTDKGNVRSLNEDSVLDRPDCGIWAVADGMGGHAGGDVASRMLVDALHALSREGSTGQLSPGAMVDAAEDAVIEVNRHLRRLSDARGDGIMGTTLAMLLAFPSHCVIGWVGDSRIYIARAGAILQITADHSAVEELITKGEITREEGRDHHLANVVTRAVGGAEDVHLDLDVLAVLDGDRFLICSDGLYKELTDEEILRELSKGDAAEACDALIQTALERTCSDNVTVVVVEVLSVEESQTAGLTDKTVPLPP